MNGTVRGLAGVVVALIAVEQITASVWAGEAHRMSQRDRAFEVKEIDIARGDRLLFSNHDPFLHQIYIISPGLNFESDEQLPGEIIEVKFSNPGIYEMRCHIHPKMLLTVHVK
jgi:plastocyanin